MKTGSKRTSLKNKKIFLKLFLSYLIVFIIPIIILGILVHNNFLQLLKMKEIDTNIILINQVRNIMDLNIKQLDELNAQLSINPNVIKFLYSEESDKAEKTLMVKDIINDFKKDSLPTRLVETVALYFSNNDIIITPVTLYEPLTFYQYASNYLDMDFNVWFDKMKSTTKGECWPSAPISSSNINKNIVTYLQPILQSGNKNHATLIALIDEEQILSIFGDEDGGLDNFCGVLDQNNTVITSNFKHISDLDLAATVLKENHNYSSFEYQGESYIAVYTASMLNGWKYFRIISESVFMRELTLTRMLFFGILMLCIIIDFILSYILCANNYRPIKNIIEFIQSEKKALNHTAKGEYDIIMDTIRNSIAESIQAEENLRKQMPILRTHYFLQLLKGNMMSTDEISRLSSLYSVEFPYPSFSVIVIKYDDYGSLLKKEKQQDCGIIRYAICNIAEEIVRRNFCCYSVDLDENRVALIINTDIAALVHEQDLPLYKSLVLIRNCLIEYMQIHISMGIGTEYTSLSMIYQSYNEAVTALNYNILHNDRNIAYFNQIDQVSASIYYPLEKENQLFNYVKNGNSSDAEKLLDEIYDVNIKKRELTLSMINLLMNNIICSLYKILEELHLDLSEIIGSDLNLFEFENNKETVEEVFVRIKKVYADLCFYISKHKSNQNVDLRNRILEYINKNFSNKDLSLAGVADYFLISAPYLSKFFKEQTGYNFLDYLNRYRIAQGKKLLGSGYSSIEEVSSSVGYNSANTFIRIFKKYESITPGLYKESLYRETTIKN